MRRKSLTDIGVSSLKPRASRYTFADPELVGHYVRIQPSGSKAFVAVARDPAGKQVWATLGGCDLLTIGEARERARAVILRIRAGLPAVEAPSPKASTVADVVENWLKRHVQANGLRSERELRRLLNRHVLPAWGSRPFLTIKRSDVAALLDGVEDHHGGRQADATLAILSGLMNWYAARTDDYLPPLARRGMRRTNPSALARSRTLDDAELRAVWSAAEASGTTFAKLVMLALFTAQRRDKIVGMRWQDITDTGEWIIRTEAREKGTPGRLMLPPAALEIINGQPRLASSPFIFPARTGGPFNGHSPGKRALDKRLPGIASWTLHDCRRTARSLLSRAGVRPDVSERVLGHVVGGVQGIYDRHGYGSEIADALARLSALIESIVHPVDGANVVRLETSR